MERSSLFTTTADDVRISLDLYRGPGRTAALIVCPGFFQSKDTPTFQRLADALAGECDVLCMDFRGHGQSSGLFTFSAREPEDLDAAVAWAQTRYERIGILGFSLGAATAVILASRRDTIRTVIAVSAPSAFEDIEFQFWTPEAIRTGLTGLEQGAGCRPGNPWMEKERPIACVPSLAPRPVLFIHGTKDATVFSRHSERLYQAARDPKRLLLIEGGGHAEELFRRHAQQFLPPVRSWIQDTLTAQGTPHVSA